MTGSGPLERLRRAGLDVRVADGALEMSPASELTAELRAVVVERKGKLRSALSREAAAEELDLVTVDPATGEADLSLREPATWRQAERLRKLARHPSFGEKRKRLSEIVEEAVDGGLTEAGAYVLLGRFGDAIADREQPVPELTPPAAGGTCEACGRDVGPTSTRCGRCKRARG